METSTKSLVRDLVVYGSGGMGQEIVDLVEAAGPSCGFHLLGYLDDDDHRLGAEILGFPVLGNRAWLTGRSGVAVALGIGAPSARRRASTALIEAGAEEFPALIHPSAYVGRKCEIGPGSIIGAQACLTTDVKVGALAIVNAGATVSHNCGLADLVTVAPGAHIAGNVRCGEGADIGIGASIVQGLTIGEWSVVGAGAVVIKGVDANTTVVGCPARAISSRAAGWHQ